MSATRTFSPLGAGNVPGTTYVNDSPWGYQSSEKARQGLDIALYLPHIPLGGEEGTGQVTGAATWVPVTGYLPVSLNGDSVGGLTLQAVVVYKTENAAQAVQVRLRNVTDSSNAALGTSSTSTTPVEETLTVTLASGVKSYRLEMLGGATHAVAAWGFLRFRTVPA